LNLNTRKRKFCFEFNTNDFERARFHLDKLKKEYPNYTEIFNSSFLNFVKLFEKQEAEKLSKEILNHPPCMKISHENCHHYDCIYCDFKVDTCKSFNNQQKKLEKHLEAKHVTKGNM